MSLYQESDDLSILCPHQETGMFLIMLINYLHEHNTSQVLEYVLLF